MTPAVSVIIAAYNYGRYLAGALDSVVQQTYRDWELIIVDDGSTDETAAVVAPYLRDVRIRYQRTDHTGQSAAKNSGISLARGRLFAFLDADDLWMPTKLEKQVALFKANPTVGVVYARRLLMDELGRRLEFEQPGLFRGRVLEAMFRNNFICFSSAIIHRRVFRHVGLFDESLTLAVDYEFWLRAAAAYAFDYVDEPLVHYRTGHANLSQRTEERLKLAFAVMQRFQHAPEARRFLTPAMVREATAETCYHIALATRSRSRLGALPWYIRCLALSPRYGLAWQGLASLPLPEAARRWLRLSLGRPADWAVRRPIENVNRTLPASVEA
jgi:glycosyltransferase involved in cell wall biosynthesis